MSFDNCIKLCNQRDKKKKTHKYVKMSYWMPWIDWGSDELTATLLISPFTFCSHTNNAEHILFAGCKHVYSLFKTGHFNTDSMVTDLLSEPASSGL